MKIPLLSALHSIDGQGEGTGLKDNRKDLL